MGQEVVRGYLPAGNVGLAAKAQITAALERPLSPEDLEPNANQEILDARLRELSLVREFKEPARIKEPMKTTRSVPTFVHYPAVKAWILRNTKRRYEARYSEALFKTDAGEPFLEVHRAVPLADGGADTPSKAVSVGPVCHRRLRLASAAAALRARHSSLLRGLIVLIAFAASLGAALAADPTPSKEPTWELHLVSDYTCVGTTGVNYSHTDHHEGSVSFAMPERSGPVEAGGGGYSYSSSGQTMGHAWRIDAKGTLTFTGEITPGRMRFRAEVYLADGRQIFDPNAVVEIPVFDGATAIVPVRSVPEVTCTGQAVWTLHGQPLERYRIVIDDRLLWAKDHGVFSGYTYRTGATIQILTGIELVVEGKKIRSANGTRRLGRVTPTSNPPGVWAVTTPARTCPDDGLSYPHAPSLGAGEVSATVRDENTIAMSVSGGTARLAVEWVIDPKAAKAASPDIQYGEPERFNGYWCAKMPLPITRWSFTRRKNSVTVTEDSFDHLQFLTVTQEPTASSAAPSVTTGGQPQSRYFKGDTGP